MANEVLVGLRIGAAVSGSLSAAFSSAKSTVRELGRATDGLTSKQKLIGSELSASVARGGMGVERLRRQYDQVGRAIDQLKSKQERLNTSIARGETLKNERSELRGEAMETIGTAAVAGAPIAQAMNIAMEFKDQVRDTAITGGFDEAKEKSLSDVMRGSALKWNQTQTEVANGIGVLIAGNIAEVKELEAYAPTLAKFATATRASMNDLGAVALALNDSLGITSAGFERSMNMLSYAGKSGQFELADMAKWLPKLAPQFSALGITGERAVAEIGASLQIARKGAGSNDEAANNFQNFLNKLTSPETIASFEKAGIDLRTAMKNMVSEGLSPAEGMIRIITAHLGKKAPAAAAEYRKALDLKDDQERQMALTRLDEAYKLGALFADQQVLGYVRPALVNQNENSGIQQGSTSAADKGGGDTDWAMRMGSPKEQLKALTVGLADLGITVGSILLPALVDLTQTAVPMVRAFSIWAENNAGLVSGTIKLLAGFVALKLGIIGIRYGINLGATALNSFGTILSVASGRLALFNSALLSARLAPFIAGVKNLTAVVPGLSGVMGILGGVIAATPIGWIIAGIAGVVAAGLLIYKYWEPIKAWVGGFFDGFAEGLAPISDAFLTAFAPLRPLLSALGTLMQPVIQWFSELLSPVEMSGEALDGITSSGMTFGRVVGGAISAILTPLRWLLEGIGEIPKAFEGGLIGVTSLLLNFSPVGMFYRAFAGVMSYFGVELPGKFSEFGGLILGRLAEGITNTAVWNEIKAGFSGGLLGIAELILNFSPIDLFYNAFAGVMSYFGIELPGKFTEFGGMLVTGLVNGISNMAGSLKDSVVGIGSSVKGWFTETLGIQSPSRVFMGYGANISEGAALGITAQSAMVRKAALGMASKSAVDLAPAVPSEFRAVAPAQKPSSPLPPNPAEVSRASMMGSFGSAAQGAAPGAGSAPVFHFSPQINVPGGPNVRDQVGQALQAGYADFVKMMERYNHDIRRRSYGSPDEGLA
ncbi:hypothetical protein TX25_06160 [Pseudomonas lactis]|uniref:phage tail tape measure protein n=1 Tax=Pseudomonas lactis TaxID=1615674 RepID=UPI00071602C0|nr:phage tail tape measure protein [Pseudomonas lactis]KRP97485.1 hypothetical protein TX25_06160 [Pseudomonas lactis]